VTPVARSIDSIAEQLVAYLRRRPAHAYKPEYLIKRFAIDRETFDRSLKLLSLWEYRIRVRATGIAFISAPDQLTQTEIAFSLRTKFIGKNVLAYRSVQSTNDVTARQAESGAAEGTIVVADQQTKGRGRLGRKWFSPPRTGIYLSVVLRPKFRPDEAPGLSLMTALALADSLSQICPKKVQIKWPNDLLVDGRKVAGILTELSAERERISFVVIGVGINVNQGVTDFPDDIRDTATSLRRVTRRKVNRLKLLRDFLYRLEQEYAIYRKGGLRKSQQRLRKYSSLLGQTVTVLAGREPITGIARDIDEQGRLILECDGRRVPVAAGEVTVAKV
jgi:BirA family transcriptional regulator, biotin operon repressor / biotin---[acetyl-CoA-carboxylase] ligase